MKFFESFSCLNFLARAIYGDFCFPPYYFSLIFKVGDICMTKLKYLFLLWCKVQKVGAQIRLKYYYPIRLSLAKLENLFSDMLCARVTWRYAKKSTPQCERYVFW